jgi:hypothetical protein
MDSRGPNGDDRERRLDRDIERYRQAATSALDQLEWCIDCLYRVRKPDIARAQPRTGTRSLSVSASGVPR